MWAVYCQYQTGSGKELPIQRGSEYMSVMERAKAKFERKMSLPQYSEYQDNEDAQMILMNDCIREAGFEEECNGSV